MLAISQSTSDALTTALEGTSVPDGAGLRISAGPQTERGVAIEITFVTAPDPSDQVIEAHAPADVFVEPVAAQLLDDQVLDATMEADGALSFALHPQSPDTGDGASAGG